MSTEPETITLTLTPDQVGALNDVACHAERWHAEWAEYIKDDAVINGDTTQEESDATEAEHNRAADFIQWLRTVLP